MISLVLGGARAGKSDFAERLAARSGRPVLYVATMEPGDDEMRDRIAAHRARRPAAWRTVEAPRDPVAALRAQARPGEFVIVDCVTLLVTNVLLDLLPADPEPAAGEMAQAVAAAVARADALLDWAAGFDGDVAFVSNEAGLGVVPAYALGRVFRDALGGANRRIAARADEVYYLVAGLVLGLRSLGAQPLESFGEVPP